MGKAHQQTNQAVKNGDTRPYRQIFKEKLSQQHQNNAAVRDKYANQTVKNQNNQNLKTTIKNGLVNNLKSSFIGGQALFEIAANTAVKAQQKHLDAWANEAEAAARALIKVYETDI